MNHTIYIQYINKLIYLLFIWIS